MNAQQSEEFGRARMAAGAPDVSRSRMLLLADGNPDMHAVYGAFLECQGFVLTHAWSPAECMRMARASGCAGVVASVGRRGLLSMERFGELAALAAGCGFGIVGITTDPYVAMHSRHLAPRSPRVLLLPCPPRRLAAAIAHTLRRAGPPGPLH